MELNGEVTELKLKIGYADNSISVQSENRSRLEEQARASAAATAQLSENAAQLEREGAELEERIQSAANVISGYRLRMQQAKDRLDAETEKRGALERAIAQKTLRLQTLRDMQAHFEGYYGSVRSVMQASARGVLRGVEGPVSELIRTQDRYAVAVETALGSQIQNIVVGTDADAKAAIQYLKSGGAGRATFLPVATIRGRVNEPSALRGAPGYLGPASGRRRVRAPLSRHCRVAARPCLPGGKPGRRGALRKAVRIPVPDGYAGRAGRQCRRQSDRRFCRQRRGPAQAARRDRTHGKRTQSGNSGV